MGTYGFPKTEGDVMNKRYLFEEAIEKLYDARCLLLDADEVELAYTVDDVKELVESSLDLLEDEEEE